MLMLVPVRQVEQGCVSVLNQLHMHAMVAGLPADVSHASVYHVVHKFSMYVNYLCRCSTTTSLQAHQQSVTQAFHNAMWSYTKLNKVHFGSQIRDYLTVDALKPAATGGCRVCTKTSHFFDITS